MSFINFKLKNPDEIPRFGTEPQTVMHWFGLTDGDLWLSLGHKTFYEYTDAILRQWSDKESPYNDYYLSRFTEDFIDLFLQIAEPIPPKLYSTARTYSSLYSFYEKAKNWLQQLPDREQADFETDLGKHDVLTKWIDNRTLDSSHLQGGPRISYFRHSNKISLVWKSDYLSDNQLPLWTAGNGELEMDYEDFVYQVEDFGQRFFYSMENQVALAVAKDWGNTVLDKPRLMEEQKERRLNFNRQFALLRENSGQKTDWDLLEEYIQELVTM